MLAPDAEVRAVDIPSEESTCGVAAHSSPARRHYRVVAAGVILRNDLQIEEEMDSQWR